MNFHKRSYVIVFVVDEYESGVKIQKLKMADPKWWSYNFEKRQNLLNFFESIDAVASRRQVLEK